MSRQWTLLLAVFIVCAVAPAAASAATDPDWEQARTIEIELSNFEFTPRTLKLDHGQPYRLRLVNRGSGGHNFSAPAFFKAATLAPEDAPAAARGAVEVKKGQSLDLRLIPAAGRYKLKCTHFLHSAFGMKGEIIVE